MTTEELQALVEANARAIAELTASTQNRFDVIQAGIDERSKSTAQIVNLAFALIASATIAIVIRIAFGR